MRSPASTAPASCLPPQRVNRESTAKTPCSMDADAQGHARLPYPGLPDSLPKLAELMRSWGYDPELYGDFERSGIRVHSGRDYSGRVEIRPRPNNPAWQVEAIHRSWSLRFQCEVTRVRELRCVLELALRTDLSNEGDEQ